MVINNLTIQPSHHKHFSNIDLIQSLTQQFGHYVHVSIGAEKLRNNFPLKEMPKNSDQLLQYLENIISWLGDVANEKCIFCNWYCIYSGEVTGDIGGEEFKLKYRPAAVHGYRCYS